MYRMWLPHLYMPESDYIATELGKPIDLELLSRYKVAIVQRQMSRENYRALELLRGRGVKVIYDLDDNLWNIPPWNPAKRIFDARALSIGMLPCIQLCNAVTVSTPYLKKLIETKLSTGAGKNIPVIVVRNAIDLNQFVRSRPRRVRNEVVVGWAGTNTHDADIDEAMIALAAIMLQHQNVRFEIMGIEIPKPIRKRSSLLERTRLHPYVPIWCYPSWFSNLDWDIALAPLVKHPFNDSKSSLKLYEPAALHVPSIASKCAPEYAEFVAGDEVLESLLVDNTRGDWKAKLDMLIRDRGLREEASERAYKRVYEHCNIAQRVNEWRTVIASI